MTLLQDIEVDDDRDVADRRGRATTTDRDAGSRRRGSGRDGLDSVRENRSRAAQRAIDRRRRRMDRDDRRAGRTSPRAVSQAGAGYGLRQRISGMPFVVPVLALLVVGLGLSLWLSTKAAQDSYRLGIARQENQSLSDKRDSLKQDYESGDSAPELSDKASRLGLIAAQNPARMVVGPDGRVRVIGTPEPAQGKSMTSINPPNRPDPVDAIDPKKVDDSQGLPGTAVTPGADAATNDSDGQQNSGERAPAPQPDPAAPAAPAPPAAGAPGVAPAPNVLPAAPAPNRNAPGANSAQSR